MANRPKTLERALEEAVSRALRDNLAPLQRTADELQTAYADLIAACSSTRPSNALPAMLRAQTAASSLAAGLSVLSNFVAVALNPREHADWSSDASAAAAVAEPEVEETPEEAPAETPVAAEAVEAPDSVPVVLHTESAPTETPKSEAVVELEWNDAPAVVESNHAPTVEHEVTLSDAAAEDAQEKVAISDAMASNESATNTMAQAEVPTFDVASLTPDLQDLHKRANRVAKVAMQDIQLLRPKDVRLGREHQDICERLRPDLDKARKEYDRRFRAILDHPVDYFHRWMVEILAGGDEKSLGDYPYPSPVLRH